LAWLTTPSFSMHSTDAGGAVVADLQVALDEADGAFALAPTNATAWS
jgi:hypothetical protein